MRGGRCASGRGRLPPLAQLWAKTPSKHLLVICFLAPKLITPAFIQTSHDAVQTEAWRYGEH